MIRPMITACSTMFRTWGRRSLALIEPHYPKAGNGTQPKPMEQMLRIYFMQNWFNLSDPQAEDSLYDIESMRRFAGIELMGIQSSMTVEPFESAG